MSDKLTFVLCVEQGELEKQAKLLISSIRRFGGALKDSPIKSYSPRPGNNVSPDTLNFFKQHDVHHINEKLNLDYTHYGYGNKVFASAHAEDHSDSDFIAFLDSDMVVLNEPKNLLLPPGRNVGLRPVEIKLIGTNGKNDSHYKYWDNLYSHFNIQMPDYKITTTVSQENILPYWNAGAIVLKKGMNLSEKWKTIFEEIMTKGLHPSKWLNYYADQVALAIMTSTLPENHISILPNGYNYPISRHTEIPKRYQIYKVKDLTLMHYHRIFLNPYSPNPLQDFIANDDRSEWLKDKLYEFGLNPRKDLSKLKYSTKKIYLNSINRIKRLIM